METHHVTQQAKGLKGRPGFRMNLGGSYVERPKDTHRERVEGQRHVKLRKKNKYTYKKRGGPVPGRPIHTLSDRPQGTTSK